MKKSRLTTRQMALDAMLVAMCTVLAAISLKLGGNGSISIPQRIIDAFHDRTKAEIVNWIEVTMKKVEKH